MARSMTGTRTPTAGSLRRALAAREEAPEDWLVFGNGAADLIVRLAMVSRPRQALVPAPTFSEYEAAGGSGGEDPPVFPGRGQGLPGDGGLCRGGPARR
ncbi:MAG: hypothetical protein ACLU9S_11895 [Oscillospiraceae bacterium]